MSERAADALLTVVLSWPNAAGTTTARAATTITCFNMHVTFIFLEFDYLLHIGQTDHSGKKALEIVRDRFSGCWRNVNCNDPF